MRIIVTGGAGFIGANFIYYLLDRYPEDRVICVDALTYAGNADTLERAAGDPRFVFCRTDICDRDAVRAVFEKERPDAVVNFAAESHVDRSIEQPDVFLRTNVLGTQVLLDACRDFGTGRFHQVSTDEVYGDLPLDRPDMRFTEETPLHPSSPYSASKAAADLLVLSYVRTYGLGATVSRCSNNYGPFQFPEKLIPLMITHALEDRPLPVYGTGQNVRDWVHVEDHCAAIDRIVRRGRPGEVYNIGAGQERSNLEIVGAILEKLGKGRELITFVPDRKGHDLRYAVDSSKIHVELGWEPAVSLEQGLGDTVGWYLENETWWRRILTGEYRKIAHEKQRESDR